LPDESWRVAALDVGEVRTGVAVSDSGRVIASPLDVIPSGDLSTYLGRLVDERGICEVARLDALKTEFPGVRFVEWDERFTTRLAPKRRGKTARVDHLAAARMLQEYLEARNNL
jgi:putative Holliday junction resolvase